MIYVMSDIHGQKRRFDSVMRQIGLRAEDTLYVLGDVIDRNPDGIGILEERQASATAAKTSFGVFQPRHFLGRELIRSTTESKAS